MLSKGGATQWPMLLDMTKDECRKVLRRLELEAYSSVVTVLRAQGGFTLEKKRLLQDLATMLSISTERHRAEIRLAVNSEKLATIAEQMSGPNTGLEWSREGRRFVPLMPRLVPQTAFIPRANLAAHIVAAKNAQLPQPSQTAKKIEIKKEPEDVKYSIPEDCITQSPSNNVSPPVPADSTSNTTAVFAVPLPPSKPTIPLILSKSTGTSSSSKSTIPPSPLKPTVPLPPSKPTVPSSSLKSTIPPVPKPTPSLPTKSNLPPPPKPSDAPAKSTVPPPPKPSDAPAKSTATPPPKPTDTPAKSTVPSLPKTTVPSTKSTLPLLPKSTISPSTSTVSPSSTFVVPPIPPCSSSSTIITPSEPTPLPIKPVASSTSKVPLVIPSPSPLPSNNSSVPIVSVPSATATTSSESIAPSTSNVTPPVFVIPAAPSSSSTILSTSLTSTNLVVSPSSSDPPAFVEPAVPTSSTIIVPPSPLSSLLSMSSQPSLISDSPLSTLTPCTSISIDTPLTYVVSSISNSLTLPTVSPLQQTPVSDDQTSTKYIHTSTDLSPLSTSSFLSSIPLISIPPSSSFSSPITATSAVVSSSPLVELIDIGQPLMTTALRQLSVTSSVKEVEGMNEKAEDNKLEDVSPAEVHTLPPPTLMLPSGMSIQLRESDTDKPKKRKRSLSQDSAPVLHKKIITVPLTKVTGASPMRTMTIQTPVKISVNTPVISRNSSTPTSSSTSTQKVIIVSNSNTPNTPNILQKSLSIVKTHNRFQCPQLAGNSLQSAATKLRPKMLTVPAKCRGRSNSIVIPMSSSFQNIQLKPAKEDNTSVIDSTVKCLTIPNVPGTTRILPKPSMLIVNPTSSKVPLTSTNTRLISSHAITEAKTIKSSTKTGKPNVVIVRKGSVTKGLKITNASKELMSKMLSGTVQSKRATLGQPKKHMTNPMPIATASGNLILLDLSQDQYSHSATIAEILQASGILPASLSLPPAPVTTATVTMSSSSQHTTVLDVESAAVEAQSSEWIQVGSSSSNQIVSSIQEISADSSVITLDGPLEFLNEEESGSSQIVDMMENTESEGQTEIDLSEEEQQVFSLTTDLTDNNVAYITADTQFETQPVTSQIIIEAVPTQASSENSQITFLPSLNAPVTIQHSDLDASNMPLEEYTSQQIENQSLT